MAKKVFDPFVMLMMPTPEPTTVTGGGTGQSTPDEYLCDFADWQTMFARDVDGDGDTDFDDYKLWFQGYYGPDDEEGQEMWELYGNDGTLYP